MRPHGGNPDAREAFQAFVAGTFYKQMLSSLRSTVHKSEMFHGGRAEEVFQGQLDQQVAEDLAASPAMASSRDDSRSASVARDVAEWAEAWSDAVSRYSAAWWSDLRRGYPESWATFERALRTHKRRGAAALRPHLRPELHAGTALTVLELILDRLPSPEVCERLGVTRREAIGSAIALWARGALVDRRAETHH